MNSHKIRTSLNKIGVIFTTFLFLFTFSALIFNSIFNNDIISKYFSKIEQQDVISKIEQSKKIFEYQFKHLDSIVLDYAIWDDIYNKIQDENIDENWFDINYSKWLSEKLDIDLIIVANRNKEIVLQYGLSDNSNTILNDIRISQSFNENSYNENISFTGFKEYNGDIYLIGACPIFQTTTEGTSKGVVILGKKITPTFLQTINEQFGNDLVITYDNKFVSTPELKNEFEENSSILNNNKDNPIYEFSNSKIIGSSKMMV
jgi:sensor domain CHASE-containing protein